MWLEVLKSLSGGDKSFKKLLEELSVPRFLLSYYTRGLLRRKLVRERGIPSLYTLTGRGRKILEVAENNEELIEAFLQGYTATAELLEVLEGVPDHLEALRNAGHLESTALTVCEALANRGLIRQGRLTEKGKNYLRVYREFREIVGRKK